MPETTHNDGTGCADDELPPATVFALLANERRYLAMRYLTSTVGATSVGDLADQIALREGEHTRDRYERVATSLVHVHLPKLAAAGVVRYDADTDTVATLDRAASVTPYLDVVERTTA